MPTLLPDQTVNVWVEWGGEGITNSMDLSVKCHERQHRAAHLSAPAALSYRHKYKWCVQCSSVMLSWWSGRFYTWVMQVWIAIAGMRQKRIAPWDLLTYGPLSKRWQSIILVLLWFSFHTSRMEQALEELAFLHACGRLCRQTISFPSMVTRLHTPLASLRS